MDKFITDPEYYVLAKNEKPFLTAVASLAGGYLASKGARDANKTSAASVDQQLQFQRESAQNAYQWATKDMRKAGINPMLAYQQGGSQALSGASYTAQNEAAAGVNAAKQIQALNSEMGLMRAQMEKTKSETELNEIRQDISQIEELIKGTQLPAAQTKESFWSTAGDLMDDIKEKGLAKPILGLMAGTAGSKYLKGLFPAAKKAGSAFKGLSGNALRQLKRKILQRKNTKNYLKRKGQWK